MSSLLHFLSTDRTEDDAQSPRREESGMPKLSFTNEEVAQAAGKDPWRRQREFSEELDPDDMAETAATYRQAAAKAGGAGELAEKATEVATRGGHLGGRDIVDGHDRIDHTARGLQGNGEDMDQVVSLL